MEQMSNRNDSEIANKTYLINKKHYALKQKYTLKEWGEIIRIIGLLNLEDSMNSLVVLMAENKLQDLLNIILNAQVKGDIYEEDFEAVTSAVNDFFSRKKSLMKSMNQPSAS
jgi:hypothetical protein